ncbi:MAG: ATP-sensitive inward rectifier potassium channel 10, partial [Alphaproteobacteria bacterium]|nr:ATP-sensitive inward rectifier potassium channel 10 [Alphaproteobacteria bacterium]
MSEADKQPALPPSPAFRPGTLRDRERVAIVRGQDGGRYTDIYHAVLRVPWWAFFLGLAAAFAAVNAVFALLYLVDRGGIEHARPGNFWDAFVFSAQTMGSINYSVMVPKSAYVNLLVIFEAFAGYVVLALFTGMIFARFSRPFARVVFSRSAVVTTFDGTLMLMFRAANQRGNSILDATVTVSLASNYTTREGDRLRRFQELKLVRSSNPLFALSWTMMHPIDETSPLYNLGMAEMIERDMQIVVMLSGMDETISDRIF